MTREKQEYLELNNIPTSDSYPSILLNKYVSSIIAFLVCEGPKSKGNVLRSSEKRLFYYKNYIGRWANTSIEVVDDYSEEEFLRTTVQKTSTDITSECLAMLCEIDEYIKNELAFMFKSQPKLIGQIALLENNVLQFELDKIYGNNWKDDYYKNQ